MTWDYPAAELTNVVFEVYVSTNLTAQAALASAFDVPSDFTFYETVAAPPVSIFVIPNTAQFFIVRARNINSGLVSYWNR